MAKFHFLRRPLKLLLYGLVFLLASVAGLVFGLQYILNELVLEHLVSGSAYVGTVYTHQQEWPMLQTVPDEIVTALADSENVAGLSVRTTRSGCIEGAEYVLDGFGMRETVERHFFIEGTVTGTPAFSGSALGPQERCQVSVTKVWGGNWDTDTIALTVYRAAGVDAPLFREGDHIFFVGRWYPTPIGGIQGAYLVDPAAIENEADAPADSALWHHSLLVVPPELDEAQSEAYIREYMEHNSLWESCQLANEASDLFTVYQVEDMSMLMTVADQSTFIAQGRELRPSDVGKRVCVLSQAAARANGFAVGDSIWLSLSDGCYVSSVANAFVDGRESGYPYEGDALLEYGEAEAYEIVGLYSDVEHTASNTDFFHFSMNDVFIPADTTSPELSQVQACALTFRVNGPKYEAFMDEFEVWLNERGHSLSIVDTGWENVSASFYAMQDRQILMLGGAVAAFLVAIGALVFLLMQHFRYEYGLRRLLGATPWEAGGVYVAGFLFTAVPAGVLAVGGAFATYQVWLKETIAAAVSVPLPGAWGCLALLGCCVAAELLLALLVLLLATRYMRGQDLLKLVK